MAFCSSIKKNIITDFNKERRTEMKMRYGEVQSTKVNRGKGGLTSRRRQKNKEKKSNTRLKRPAKHIKKRRKLAKEKAPCLFIETESQRD